MQQRGDTFSQGILAKWWSQKQNCTSYVHWRTTVWAEINIVCFLSHQFNAVFSWKESFWWKPKETGFCLTELKAHCYSLAAAGNKSTTQPPLPRTGVRRRIERNRQKLVGQDKGSLREQQTEGTVTTTIQIRRIRHAFPSRESLPAAQLPPARTRHDGTWCGIPCSVWPGWVSPSSCAPSWILVKINPVLAEPRTPT